MVHCYSFWFSQTRSLKPYDVDSESTLHSNGNRNFLTHRLNPGFADSGLNLEVWPLIFAETLWVWDQPI
jgi:hypothetical protein